MRLNSERTSLKKHGVGGGVVWVTRDFPHQRQGDLGPHEQFHNSIIADEIPFKKSMMLTYIKCSR